MIKLHPRIEFVLGELLHLSNSQPPFHWRIEFYRLKDDILSRHGTVTDMDVQHIRKECFNCAGSGRIDQTVVLFGQPWQHKGRVCWKCGGTGKYEEFWVHLMRYKLGRHEFHIPVKKIYSAEDVGWVSGQKIEGYICHQPPKHYLAHEAAYWLALLFDLNLFLRKFGSCGYPSAKFTPMVIFSDLYWKIGRIPQRIKNSIRNMYWRIILFRQSICVHDFGPQGDEFECRKCAEINPSDIPF